LQLQSLLMASKSAWYHDPLAYGTDICKNLA